MTVWWQRFSINAWTEPPFYSMIQLKLIKMYQKWNRTRVEWGCMRFQQAFKNTSISNLNIQDLKRQENPTISTIYSFKASMRHLMLLPAVQSGGTADILHLPWKREHIWSGKGVGLPKAPFDIGQFKMLAPIITGSHFWYLSLSWGKRLLCCLIFAIKIKMSDADDTIKKKIITTQRQVTVLFLTVFKPHIKLI